MRDLPRPLETAATARYRWDPAVASRFEYVDRFGEPVKLWRRQDDELLLPRAACPLGLVDGRVEGDRVSIVSSVVPRNPEQARVIREASALLEAGESFVLSAPTGHGKTAVTCALLASVGRKALVVVHKLDLLEQWRAALLQHTDLETQDIGTIQGPTCDVAGRKLAIAMIQTLVMREHAEDLADAFGLVVFDECHHIGADVFSRAASMFPAKLRLGLSATPERADGRERTVKAHIGPVRVRARAQTLRPLVFRYASSWRRPRRRNGEPIPIERGRTVIADKSLAKDRARNALLLSLVLQAHEKGRHAVIFSSLVSHLETLRKMAIQAGVPEDDTLLYVAATKPELRETAPQRRLLFATFGMLSEGTDIPRLDCAIFATPRSRIQQAVGRVLRELPGKPRPCVLDIEDDDLAVFREYAKARAWIYRQMDAEIHDRRGVAS